MIIIKKILIQDIVEIIQGVFIQDEITKILSIIKVIFVYKKIKLKKNLLKLFKIILNLMNFNL